MYRIEEELKNVKTNYQVSNATHLVPIEGAVKQQQLACNSQTQCLIMNINWTCLCLYLLCFNCSKVEYMWLHAGDDSNYNYLNKSLALEGGDNRDASMIIPSILWSGGLTSGCFDDCHSKSCQFNNPINLTACVALYFRF